MLTRTAQGTRFQLGYLKVFVLFVIPVASALAIGLWLSAQIRTQAHLEAERTRTAEVLAQDRLLVDAFTSAIDSLKVQALSLLDARQAGTTQAALPAGAILHWAELSFEAGSPPSVRQTAQSSSWAGDGFERFYLDSALAKLNLDELKKNGVAILRVRQDPQRRGEWLAMGFESRQPGRVLLVLVDPGQAFAVFSRWAPRSEAGRLRGYLVGSDGWVIAHSEPSYVATDFASTQVFMEGISPMLQGRVVRGAGEYLGIDQVSLTVAYARSGTLPLGVVVERINPPEASVLASVSWGGLAAGLAALLAYCIGAPLWIQRQTLINATASLQSAQESAEDLREMSQESKEALLGAMARSSLNGSVNDPAWRPAQDYESVSSSYENENDHA